MYVLRNKKKGKKRKICYYSGICKKKKAPHKKIYNKISNYTINYKNKLHNININLLEKNYKYLQTNYIKRYIYNDYYFINLLKKNINHEKKK